MNVPEWMYVGDIVNQLEMELIIGNGSAAAGHRLIEDIARRVSEARRKHPVFAEGKYHALGVIGEEYQEVVQAVEKETPDRVYQELLDLITTSIRAANGEHEVGHGPADVRQVKIWLMIVSSKNSCMCAPARNSTSAFCGNRTTWRPWAWTARS